MKNGNRKIKNGELINSLICEAIDQSKFGKYVKEGKKNAKNKR